MLSLLPRDWSRPWKSGVAAVKLGLGNIGFGAEFGGICNLSLFDLEFHLTPAR